MDEEDVCAILALVADEQRQIAESKQAALSLHESKCEYERKKLAAVNEDIRILKQERRRLEMIIQPPDHVLSSLEMSRAASFAALFCAAVLSGRPVVFQPHADCDEHRTVHCILTGRMGLFSRDVETVLQKKAGPGLVDVLRSRARHVWAGSIYKSDTGMQVFARYLPPGRGGGEEEEVICVDSDDFFGLSWEIDPSPRVGEFYIFN